MTSPREFDSKAVSVSKPYVTRGALAVKTRYKVADARSPQGWRYTSKVWHEVDGGFKDATDFAADIKRMGVRMALAAWADVLDDTPVRPSGPTVGEWVNKHIDIYSTAKEPDKRKQRERLRCYIMPTLGSVRVSELTDPQIQEWMTMLANAGKGDTRGGKKLTGLSPTTVGHAVGLLKSSLRSAVRAKVITQNPSAEVRLPAREGMPQWIREAEFPELHDAFDEHYHVLLEFLVGTGARWGEVTGLHPRDVHPNGSAHIWQVWVEDGHDNYVRRPHPKNRYSIRDIDIPPKILAKLDLDRSRKFVFTDPNGEPYNAHDFINDVWDPTVKPLNFSRKPTPKTLRSTYATWQANRGVNPKVVQYQMGHANIATTMKYYTARDAEQSRKAADGLDDLF